MIEILFSCYGWFLFAGSLIVTGIGIYDAARGEWAQAVGLFSAAFIVLTLLALIQLSI